MSQGKILIAGVGNIFFGDDAFGVEVARGLARRRLPEGVHVVDFGIRGLDLAYALVDDYEAVIIVDAVSRGGPPGTLYLLEPNLECADGPAQQAPMVEPHALDPEKVLWLARCLGSKVGRFLLVGCEPTQPFSEEDDFRMEMSAPVQAAVEEAILLVESLVSRLRCERPLGANHPPEAGPRARSCTSSP
jgi:hydrogenase maturation protease